MSKEFYSVKEVADMFQKTTRTINNWRKRGLIGSSKIGRTVVITGKQIRTCLDRHSDDPEDKIRKDVEETIRQLNS